MNGNILAHQPGKTKGLLMNTKNDPENDKLLVNEEETAKELQPVTLEETPTTEKTLSLDPPVKEDLAAPIVAEKEINSVPEKVVPEDVLAVKTVEPENEIEVIDPAPQEVVSPDVEENDPEEHIAIDYDLEDAFVEEDAEEDAETEEEHVPEESGISLLPIEEIVAHLRKLLQSDNPKRKDVDEVKNQFYRSLRNETEEQKQAFLAEGGEEINFVVNESELFAEGKELLQKIKEKRSVIAAQEEAEKEKNVARKLAIIDQIKVLTETQGQEDFNKSYQEFKSLQQEWNDIKQVPQAKVNELWKSYQRYVEKFYDLVRINNEFREYDFKKNLELKTDLCVAAEKLNDEPDVDRKSVV